MTLPDRSQARIEELESIRGLAAFLVVLFHIQKWSGSFNVGIISNGYLMVDLFFVLSGFVIYNAYARRLENPKELLKFQFLRFGRLYPVHLLFLLAFFFIEILRYYGQALTDFISPETQPFKENSFTAFWQQLLLLQAIGPTGNAVTYNAPAWSISVEFYTYLLFGLVALNLSKLKNMVFLGIFLSALGLILTDYTFGFSILLHCCVGFFLGCLVAGWRERLEGVVPAFFPAAAFVVIIIFLAVKSQPRHDVLIYFLAAALIMGLIGSKNSAFKNLLKLKFLIWLGTISYSMYMSHFLVIWTANIFFTRILHRPETVVDGRNKIVLSTGEAAAAYILIIGLVFLVSHLVYTHIERPLRQKSRQVVSRD